MQEASVEVRLGLLGAAGLQSFLLLLPSAAQLMEEWEGLKSRGGLCCSEEPGSEFLRCVSGVGKSSLVSQCLYLPISL